MEHLSLQKSQRFGRMRRSMTAPATKQSVDSPPFPDDPKDQTSDAQLRNGESQDSQARYCAPSFDTSHRPGMTSVDCFASLAMTIQRADQLNA